MKVKLCIVDKLPDKWEDCIFHRSDQEGTANCELHSDYCYLLTNGICPFLMDNEECDDESRE